MLKAERRTFNKILKEEIDSLLTEFDLKSPKSKQVLNELFTMNIANFMKNIGSQEIDEGSEIDTELWEWFLNTINESIQELPEEWLELFKEQKMKILCFKYFTRKDLLDVDDLEKDLRTNIRKYFTALQNYTDLEGFKEKISNLPSELLSNLIRYLFKVSPELNDKVKITKPVFTERVKELKEERLKMIEAISFISKSYKNVFDISKMKILIDNGLFFEDNLLNRAVNEYIVKLTGNKVASQKIKETFSNTLNFDLQSQTESSSAYIAHIESIKTEQSMPYFTDKGYQIGNRFSNEIDLVKEKDTENKLIDKDSVFKEPKGTINDVVPPWDSQNNEPLDSTGEGGNSGGSSGSSGGGGASFGNSFNSDIPLGDDAEPDTELPTDDQGFPVDFGSEETNPQASEIDSEENVPVEGGEEVSDNKEEKK